MSNLKSKNKQSVFLLFIASALVMILTACSGSAGTVTETSTSASGLQQSQSNLELNWVKVSPSVVVPDQTVAVTGAVINNDSIDRIYTAELEINGVSRGTQEIKISAGKTQTFSVFVTADEVGVYNVVFGGKAAQFEVVEQIDRTSITGTESNPSVPSCCQ